MSDYTETYLTMLEMELNGLVQRPIRPDGEEGWEPHPLVTDAQLDAFLDAYDDEDPDYYR